MPSKRGVHTTENGSAMPRANRQPNSLRSPTTRTVATAASSAYAGFDVDMTLGFFELTNPLALFWSPELLENGATENGHPPLSARLRARLAAARKHFADYLLNFPELLVFVLRPNISVLLIPLLKLRQAKKLKAVVLYSNTGVTYSLELAKQLLEGLFHVYGLIGAAADIWHPFRVADEVPETDEPLKRFETLVRLLRAASSKKSGPTLPISPEQVVFVDDRQPRHALAAEEAHGLTYIVPTPFFSHPSKDAKKEILALALLALEGQGLLENEEYLSSPFCNRIVASAKTSRQKEIHGFESLKKLVEEELERGVGRYAGKWQDDTAELSAAMDAFVAKFR